MHQTRTYYSYLSMTQHSIVYCMKKHVTTALALSLILTCYPANANQPIQVKNLASTSVKQAELERKISSAITSSLDAFYTPGMAVGITYKNTVVFNRGFGIANIEKQTKVDSNTYFRLASTSKAFTAAALAILVDEKKIHWQDKVIDHLPQFVLSNAYVTREFTIADLLTHKSGLVSGAGDSMIWPEPSGFSREEVIHNLRFLTPEYSFRNKYAYSNVLYITAGELVAKISDMPFEDFIEQRIFAPLKMDCYAGDMPKSVQANAAMGYAHNDQLGIYSVPRNSITQHGLMSAAAGGMVCNANDMLKWLQALLSQTNLPFSKKQLAKMWQAHTILPVSEIEKNWDETLFKHYGLGWRIANIGKLKYISHTGTISGYQAYVAVIPALELGVVILNNGSNFAARSAVMQTIVKTFMQENGYVHDDLTFNDNDWIEEYSEYLDEREQAYLAQLATPVASSQMTIQNEDILGTYTDSWFGAFSIKREKQANQKEILRISHSKMKTLVGTLHPFQDTSYKITWDNQNAQSPAFMHFKLNVARNVVAASLYPFTNNERVNHPYRDMWFVKNEE